MPLKPRFQFGLFGLHRRSSAASRGGVPLRGRLPRVALPALAFGSASRRAAARSAAACVNFFKAAGARFGGRGFGQSRARRSSIPDALRRCARHHRPRRACGVRRARFPVRAWRRSSRAPRIASSRPMTSFKSTTASSSRSTPARFQHLCSAMQAAIQRPVRAIPLAHLAFEGEQSALFQSALSPASQAGRPHPCRLQPVAHISPVDKDIAKALSSVCARRAFIFAERCGADFQDFRRRAEQIPTRSLKIPCWRGLLLPLTRF